MVFLEFEKCISRVLYHLRHIRVILYYIPPGTTSTAHGGGGRELYIRAPFPPIRGLFGLLGRLLSRLTTSNYVRVYDICWAISRYTGDLICYAFEHVVDWALYHCIVYARPHSFLVEVLGCDASKIQSLDAISLLGGNIHRPL